MSGRTQFTRHLAVALVALLSFFNVPIARAMMESSGPGWHCVGTDPEHMECTYTVEGSSGGGGVGDWPDYLFLSDFGGAVSSGYTFPNGGGGGNHTAHTDTDKKDASKDPCDKSQASTTQANPIDVSTGQKVESDLDFQTEGVLPLTLDRQYRSYNTRDGLFGRYWESNFDFSLETSGSDLVVRIPGRGIFRFVPDATANTWKATANSLFATAVRLANGTYSVTLKGDSVQSYDAAGKVTAVKNPRGIGYDFTYDATGKLSRVTATGGRFIQFAWTGTQLTSVTDPTGKVHTYTYFADRFGAGKNLLQKVDYAGLGRSSVEYLYEDTRFPGALTGKKFGMRFSWFTYDDQGRAISSAHSRPLAADQIERYTFAYSEANGVLTVLETNPLGKQASFRFVNGTLESVTGLPGSTCPASLYTQTLDSQGFTDVITDFNDNRIDYDYDANGRVTRTTRGAGTPSAQVETNTFDAVFPIRIATNTIVGDHASTYTYDAYGRVLKVVLKNLSAVGVPNQTRTTTYAYTDYPNGMPATVTVDGPLPGTGDAVTRNYSSTGDLLTESDALGVRETYTGYNGFGEPGRVVQRFGVTYDFTYDDYGRRLTTKRTVGAVSSTKKVDYDPQGRVDRITYPDGRVESMNYDAANRLMSLTRRETVTDYQPAANETVSQDSIFNYGYDPNSDRISESAVRRRTVNTIGLDARGRPVVVSSVVTNTGAMKTTWSYDELGRLKARVGDYGQNFRLGYDETIYLTSRTDSLGRTSTYTYDPLNRLKSFTDAKGGVTTYTYDAGGRLATVTDPRGLVTRYAFDGFDQLRRLESPDAGVSTFDYDAYGRRTGETPASLLAVAYSYDGLGRVVSRQSGSAVQTFTYDSCANGTGRFCGVADRSGSTSVAYTPTGLIAQQTNVVAGSTYATYFGYDNYDRLTQLTYPDGKTASYAYLDGQLDSVSATPNGASQVVADTVRFEPSGALKGLRFGNGIVWANTYDQNGRLTGLKNTDPATGAYVQGADLGWNGNDQLTTITNARGVALNNSFVFDELGRMTSATRGSGLVETFAYDALGNRKTYSATGKGSTTLSYAATSDRLLSDNHGRAWTYDDNGNSNGYIGADGVAVGFDYDAFGRIASSSRNGVGTSYLINALGQRVSKSGPNGTSRFIFGINGRLLAELAPSGTWTDYIGAGSTLLGAIRGTALYFVHTDQIGRPEVITDAAKARVWAATNAAFDRTVTLDQIGGFNIGFPGQYFEQETGLWQNYFRDYDASLGRYLQADPLGLLAGPNPYAYVGGDPSTHADPEGLVDPSLELYASGVTSQLPERRGPDYIAFEVSRGGVTTVKSLSRSGNVITSVGGTKPGFSISLKVGYLTGCPRNGTEVDNFLKEWSKSVSAFSPVGAGGGVTWNGGGTAVEFGIGTPGGSGSLSWGAQTGSYEGAAWHSD
jgi:RHS repeat-associated protein